MKRRNLLSLLAVMPLLASCASLIGPRETEIPLAKLQEAVDRKFPTSNSLLSLFDIQLSRPALSLLPDKNRVQISMDTSIAPTLLNRSWSGSFTVSGNLAIDPAGSAVVLKSPVVEQLTLDGAGSTTLPQIRKIGGFFIEQFLTDVPLYTFDPQKLTVAGVRMKPVAIATRADRLVVTFEPVQ